MVDLKELRQKTDALLADHRLAHAQAESERTALKTAEDKLAVAIDAQHVIQSVAQSVQQVAHSKIAGLVSKCLRAVFGDDGYDLAIDFERKRGQTEAKLSFIRDGLKLDPMSSTGGGCVAVGNLAARIVTITTERPARRRIAILDEPLLGPSAEHHEALGDLLLALAEDLAMQIILVTHNEKMMVGHVVRLDR
jgi:hypothetical protein